MFRIADEVKILKQMLSANLPLVIFYDLNVYYFNKKEENQINIKRGKFYKLSKRKE
jgi:hypothetical protein